LFSVWFYSVSVFIFSTAIYFSVLFCLVSVFYSILFYSVSVSVLYFGTAILLFFNPSTTLILWDCYSFILQLFYYFYTLGLPGLVLSILAILLFLLPCPNFCNNFSVFLSNFFILLFLSNLRVFSKLGFLFFIINSDTVFCSAYTNLFY